MNTKFKNISKLTSRAVYYMFPCLIVVFFFYANKSLVRTHGDDATRLIARSVDARNKIEMKMSYRDAINDDMPETDEKLERVFEEENVLQKDEYWNDEIQKKVFPEVMPNPNFVFHNKLPKSGSSTMNNILKVLSKKLNYDFVKLDAGNMTTYATYNLINFINEVKTEDKFLLLKHHLYFDFNKYNSKQPTYINVIRNPIEWFTSRYYFSRYGWSRNPGCRENCGMSEEDKDMTIDECVQKRHIQCTEPWIYIPFFCGISNPKCENLTTTEQKKEAVEIAKYNILHNYYAVGILEQFEDTLNMFDRLLPTFYKDAANSWKSEFVQVRQGKTKTVNKKEMNEESKQYFRDGPLHYEIELYNFARKIFNERMKRLNIEPAEIEN